MTETPEQRALEAAWKACSSWDGKITKPVLRKAIEAYLKEIEARNEQMGGAHSAFATATEDSGE